MRILIAPVLLVALVVVWFTVRYFDPPIWPSCSMNGFGSGECTFTNRGFVPDRICGNVRVKRSMTGEMAHSPIFCSGIVWPSSSIQVSFVLPETRSICATPYDSGKDWTTACSFGFIEE